MIAAILFRSGIVDRAKEGHSRLLLLSFAAKFTGGLDRTGGAGFGRALGKFFGRLGMVFQADPVATSCKNLVGSGATPVKALVLYRPSPKASRQEVMMTRYWADARQVNVSDDLERQQAIGRFHDQ